MGKDIILLILGFILEGGFVAFATFVLTKKEIKRKASLENDGTSIGNTRSIIENYGLVIKDLREDAEIRKHEKAQCDEEISLLKQEREDMREENTAAKMLMCVHLGCIIRKPNLGQGDSWYRDNKSDPSLGVDYLPINRLLQTCGNKKNEEPKENDNLRR